MVQTTDWYILGGGEGCEEGKQVKVVKRYKLQL